MGEPVKGSMAPEVGHTVESNRIAVVVVVHLGTGPTGSAWEGCTSYHKQVLLVDDHLWVGEVVHVVQVIIDEAGENPVHRVGGVEEAERGAVHFAYRVLGDVELVAHLLPGRLAVACHIVHIPVNIRNLIVQDRWVRNACAGCERVPLKLRLQLPRGEAAIPRLTVLYRHNRTEVAVDVVVDTQQDLQGSVAPTPVLHAGHHSLQRIQVAKVVLDLLRWDMR
mmetsp:Transcript_31265/g.78329  ORF Transcript_31265/g.78329 Transcript_31265/m.78329 type:complete len:222 (-) Transcript_31265:1522-2187(-)